MNRPRESRSIPSRLLQENQRLQARITELEARLAAATPCDLRQSEQRYRSLFSSMTEGFAIHEVVTDDAGKPVDFLFVDINPAFERLTGLRRQDVVGRRFTQVLPGEDPQWIELYGKVALTGEPLQLEKRSVTLDRWYEIFAYQIAPRQFAVIFMDVTPLKSAREALQQREQQLQLITDTVPALISYIGSDCRYRFVNHQYETWFSVQRDRVIGKTMDEVLGAEAMRFLRPYVDQVLRGCDVRFETPAPYLSGQRWIDAHYVPDRDAAGRVLGFFVLVLDITARKQAEEALRQSEQRFRTAQDLSLDAFTILSAVRDPAGQIIDFRWEYANRQAARILRRTEQELVGARLLELLPANRLDLFPRYVRVVETGEPHDVEIAYESEGIRGWFRNMAVRLNDGVAVCFTDITARKSTEEALRQSKDQLELLARSLEDRVRQRTAEVERRATQLRQLHAELTHAEQRQRRQLATLLHDGLQQLLVAARLHVGLARKRTGRAAQNTLDQVEELLAQSIDASRSLTVELSPPILHDRGLVAALHWLARHMRDKHRLTVTVTAADADEPPGEDIRLLLFQAARELLFNVVKHAQVEHAQVLLQRRDQHLCLTVADKGKGFDPSLFRGPDRQTASFGLFSVQQRLEWLGGSIDLQSSPGQGATVTLSLPLAILQAAAAAPPTPASAAPASVPAEHAAATGPKIRVVLADDHKIVRDGLASLLAAYPDIDIVAQAGDGQAAIDLAIEHQPSVVVMDMNMPRVDGLQATRRIVAALPHVRVIGLSMHQEQDMAQAMRQAGAAGYLPKDGPVEDLVSLIRATAPVAV